MAAILDQLNTTSNVSAGINDASVEDRWAQSFVPSIGGTLDHIIVKLKITGSQSGTLTLFLYSDNGTNPNAQLSTSSNTIDVSTLTGTETEYTFNFPNDYNMVNGTKYWFVIIPSYATNGSNFAAISEQNSGNVYPAGNSNRFNVGGAVWMNDQGTNSLYFKEFVTPNLGGVALFPFL